MRVVLGSDADFYREWGYTALSRHRDAARFQVTATRTNTGGVEPALRGRRTVITWPLQAQL